MGATLGRDIACTAGLAFVLAGQGGGVASAGGSEKLGTVAELMAQGYSALGGQAGPLSRRDANRESSVPVTVGDETYVEGKLFLQKGETLAFCVFDVIVDTRKDGKHEPVSACWRVK